MSLSSIERYVKARGKVAGNPDALIICKFTHMRIGISAHVWTRDKRYD